MLQGGRQKPQLTDILAYQLLLMPVKLYQVAVCLWAGQPPCLAKQQLAKCVARLTTTKTRNCSTAIRRWSAVLEDTTGQAEKHAEEGAETLKNRPGYCLHLAAA